MDHLLSDKRWVAHFPAEIQSIRQGIGCSVPFVQGRKLEAGFDEPEDTGGVDDAVVHIAGTRPRAHEQGGDAGAGAKIIPRRRGNMVPKTAAFVRGALQRRQVVDEVARLVIRQVDVGHVLGHAPFAGRLGVLAGAGGGEKEGVAGGAAKHGLMKVIEKDVVVGEGVVEGDVLAGVVAEDGTAGSRYRVGSLHAVHVGNGGVVQRKVAFAQGGEGMAGQACRAARVQGLQKLTTTPVLHHRAPLWTALFSGSVAGECDRFMNLE